MQKFMENVWLQRKDFSPENVEIDCLEARTFIFGGANHWCVQNKHRVFMWSSCGPGEESKSELQLGVEM